MKRFEGSVNSAPRTGDAERLFAQRVRLALDESANALPQATLAARTGPQGRTARAARSRLRRAPARQFAFAGGDSESPRFGFARTGLVCSAIVLVGACLAGLYQFEQERRIEDLADMDTAVLNDDLPISAYADQGFNAYLKQNP